MLPDWDRAMAMCLSTATCFPGLRLQHWDVAFCREGQVLMELNTEADLGVPQFFGSNAVHGSFDSTDDGGMIRNAQRKPKSVEPSRGAVKGKRPVNPP